MLGNQIVIPHTVPENGARGWECVGERYLEGFTSKGLVYRYVVVISAIDEDAYPAYDAITENCQ